MNMKGYYHMDEWKTIPKNTYTRPDLNTWRASDIDDSLTYYICKGRLITEDNFIIDCIIGYKLFYGDFDEERIIPKYYKEV